jgi:hypothetical protein
MLLHPSLVKNDIRLGFVEMLDANRPSGAHSVAIVSLVAEDFGKGVDQVLVPISDGSHAKDLAIEEFDSFFWPENASLRHPVILVDRELPGRGFDGFGEKGLHKCFSIVRQGMAGIQSKNAPLVKSYGDVHDGIVLVKLDVADLVIWNRHRHYMAQ